MQSDLTEQFDVGQAKLLDGESVLLLGANYNSFSHVACHSWNLSETVTLFKGDFRGLLRPDYSASTGGLINLQEESFDCVVARHYIEHIEWIYQVEVFQRILSWMKPKGRVYIETPNLEYILQFYVKRRKRRHFPSNEHPDINGPKEAGLQRWLNFKLFSGCSPEDHHHCVYDRYYLRWVLEQAGFSNVQIRSQETLNVVAMKPSEKEKDFSIV